MGRKRKKGRGRGSALGCLLMLGIMGAGGFAGWTWLKAHPEHNPWAPLNLTDPLGWATTGKLVALKEDIPACRAVLDRSGVAYTALPTLGEGNCAHVDRTELAGFPLSPSTPAVTCPVAAGLELWRTQSVAPAARDILGSEVVRFEHMGVYNCRRMRGVGSGGGWSEHSTGNAIDISAFVLADGRRISLTDDWESRGAEARFLRKIRDDACGIFATVLSPDFNAAHADHFHFDQATRWAGVCR